MIKRIIPSILAVTLLLCHCTTKKINDPSIIIHGCIPSDFESKATTIYVEKYNNYIELYDAIEQAVCNDSIPIIDISSQSQEEYVILSNACREEYGCIFVKTRNVLCIVDDSIRVQRSYPMDSLAVILARHYFNPRKLPYHSKDPNSALIRVSYDQRDPSLLPATLKQITETYSQADYSECLHLWLERPPIKPPAYPVTGIIE